MKEELKTLEDIGNELPHLTENEEDEVCVTCEFKNLLRAEAVKWVKTMDKTDWAIKEWIIEFFNLTEEDLKKPCKAHKEFIGLCAHCHEANEENLK